MAVVQNPTWKHISALITHHDVVQMRRQGLDLRSYDQVYALAHKIYYYVGYKIMPPGGGWSDDAIATYNNWLIDGMPKDDAHRAAIAAQRQQRAATAGARVRKDVDSLTPEEVVTLKKAFNWLMSNDPKSADEYDPDAVCYFSLAGKHWYPAPTFCQHHIYGYLPWHRWQLLDFEDALRQAPGCDDVTLPYWDIETGKFPRLFSEEPFRSYTFPIDVYPDYYTPPSPHPVGRKGTMTQRNTSFLQSSTVNTAIANARTAPRFDAYNGITGYKYDSSMHIMRAHDIGHVGSGPTMANQDIAAFDPMFWFFHCNWDRLWWEWQISRNATDLQSFGAILATDDDRRWLLDPQMNISDPFGRSTAEAIDSLAIGVSYAPPEKSRRPSLKAQPLAMAPSWSDAVRGHAKTAAFSLQPATMGKVSLRVKGINRIKVQGSFWVVLSVGGSEIGRDAFFQSTFSGNCENCVAQSRVNFDFVFDRALLQTDEGEPEEVEVDVINAVTGEHLSFDEIGNPTINIRLIH